MSETSERGGAVERNGDRGPEYLIGGARIRSQDPDLQNRLGSLHGSRGAETRPRCLCTTDGAEMYVAKVAGVFQLKRMPGTGPDHAFACPSYDPPAELSGLGQVYGQAIQEDPSDGSTALRLDFPLTKLGRKAPVLSEAGESDTAVSNGTKLSLRGLLHYLWDEAGFSKWSPAMEGKRSWGVLRKYLLQAAESKHSKGAPLGEALFIPEPWNESRKEEQVQRRRALLLKVAGGTKGARKLMLVLGEVRRFEPGRYGHKLVVKHAPEIEFGVTDDLATAMKRRFETELSFWEAGGAEQNAGHLIVFGTFSVNLVGAPALEEVVLMYVTRNWIPVEDAFDQEVIERLTSARARFARGLRYNLPSSKPLACAVMAETSEGPTALYIVRPGATEAYQGLLEDLVAQSRMSSWTWRPGEGEMPPLPHGTQRPYRTTSARPAAPAQAAIDPSGMSDGFDPFVALSAKEN